MINSRWGVYQVKSRAKGSTEKALSPSTAGKAGRKAGKAGQSMGGRTKKPLKQSEYDMQVAVIDLKNSPEKQKVNFTIEGDVVPQGRPRFFRRGNMVGVYDPPKSKAWKKLVADTAIAHGCKPLDGPLEVTLMFYLNKPKSMKDGQPHIKRPDVDNLAKGVLDALNGICWHDDAQICMLVIEKDYGVWPDVNIEIGPYWKYAEE